MPQKQKLGIEKKVKIVKRYLAGKVSISTAAAEVGVGRETLQGWVMQYEAEGLEAFLPNRKNHTYSPEKEVRQSSAKNMGCGVKNSSTIG